METVKIYRLEKNGIGPYCYDDESNAYYNFKNKLHDAHDGLDHPSMAEDLDTEVYLKVRSNKFVCGCINFDTLCDWFDGFIEELLDYGFSIVEYIMPKESIIYGHSKIQVFFDKNKSVEEFYIDF
jgi:hypothetical protein